MSTETRTIEVHIDDMDGKTEGADVRPVAFAVDGTAYVMDLSEKSRERLHRALEPFISKARPEGSVPNGRSRASAATVTAKRATAKPRAKRRGKVDPAKVREWATKNGVEIADRGRVPGDVVDAYLAAKSGAAVSAPTATPDVPDTTTVTTRMDPSKVKPPAKKATARKGTARKTAAKKAAAAPAPVAPEADSGTEGVAADKE